jgi:hypothetical protein
MHVLTVVGQVCHASHTCYVHHAGQATHVDYASHAGHAVHADIQVKFFQVNNNTYWM